MEKSRGELWEGRAVDGKLKSSLEWPNTKLPKIPFPMPFHSLTQYLPLLNTYIAMHGLECGSRFSAHASYLPGSK